MNYLAEVVNEDKDLHIFINTDNFTTANNVVVVSYDGEQLAYSLETLKEAKSIDWLMGLIGRDTQNWFHNNIVIHWGDNVWKFYNKRNVSIFNKEDIKYFDIKDYDTKDVEGE